MIDIKYSQNFYKNKNRLSKMIEGANFQSSDMLLDIGAGKGVITKELSKYSENVIAYELDPTYYSVLQNNLLEFPKVIVRNEDFLNARLPSSKFKIFSNIPFGLTSKIVSKITDSNSKLVDAYLFVQEEAAERFVGVPINTQISTILSFKYNFSIVESLDSNDFSPIPSVDIVLLRIQRKESHDGEFGLYRDFVTYVYNQMNGDVIDTFKKLFTFKQIKHIYPYLKRMGYVRPSEIPTEYYLELFQYFKINGMDYRDRVKGYYIKHINQHANREKVSRSNV